MKLLLLILSVCALLSVALASTCGGNCPKDCPSCPCGNTVQKTDITQACQQYKGWNQKCCECIAQHESGGDLHAAHYNTDGSYDVGLWQINSVHFKSCNGGQAPCDLASNLKCAIAVYNEGKNFGPWTTCGPCNCCH
eukprot:TRINITY_DN796_c0_g1_i1.p1 TRINITY_DN796_c0_g1~~TRINITY_DN796_c0_g1_i1.p1  ORF type:complete len:152 (-),score=33.10 TRINITY_DN796_c0_g1_i1:198-608(-)